MLTKKIWEELGPKWPSAYWDDWLREPQQRRGRHIIRPEISRTLHFGYHGVSNAQFNEYLRSIQLNTVPVSFTKLDLSYLEADKWDGFYLSSVRSSKVVTPQSFHQELQQGITEMRVTYRNADDYVQIAKWAGVMGDVKAGVPRGAYRGIVTTYLDGVKLHLVPIDFR